MTKSQPGERPSLFRISSAKLLEARSHYDLALARAGATGCTCSAGYRVEPWGRPWGDVDVDSHSGVDLGVD